MPNIQIHGFAPKEAIELRDMINYIMQKIGLADDALTEIIDSRTASCNGYKDMPYIRICSTDSEEIQKIIQALKSVKIGVDTEWLKLTGFIPADKMR